MRRPLLAGLSLVLMGSMALLSGCASVLPNRLGQSLDIKDNALPNIVKPWAGIGAGSEPIDYVNVSNRDDFILRDAIDSDPLPNFVVKGFSYTNAALYDVIRSLVDQASSQNITLSFDLRKEQSAGAKRLVSAYNVKGSFAEILENLSATAGFYYRFKSGVLTITSDRQYITALPPVSELLESIPSVIRSLGGMEVLVDRSARLVTFRANKRGQEKIEGYLNYIRKNRSLITYDCYIWEVALNDRSQMGINWRDFPQGAAGSAAASGVATNYGSGDGKASAALSLADAALIPGGAGIGMAIKGSRFALSALVDFLQTQGTLNNVSQPKISMLSGTTAQFRNGTSIEYISKISPGVVAANGALLAGSADTATLRTGVTMTIAGDISDGTVFSDISLKLADLVRMDKQQISGSGGATISLPVSADREVNTRVRARPGDAIIVGGINIQRLSNTFGGIGPLPTASDKEVERSELVVILIPRVTYFTRDVMQTEQ
jgi:MSHA biogenesis protein MshL